MSCLLSIAYYSCIFSGIHGHCAEGNLGILDVVVLPRVVRLLRHWNGIPFLLCQDLEILCSEPVTVGS